MKDKIEPGYVLENNSMPIKQDFASPDAVNDFTAVPAADKDVGGASDGPGLFVYISRYNRQQKNSIMRIVTEKADLKLIF